MPDKEIVDDTRIVRCQDIGKQIQKSVVMIERLFEKRTGGQHINQPLNHAIARHANGHSDHGIDNDHLGRLQPCPLGNPAN
jgi:hypothetical protein